MEQATEELGWSRTDLLRKIERGKLTVFQYPPTAPKLLLRSQLISRMPTPMKKRIKKELISATQSGDDLLESAREAGLGAETIERWREKDSEFDAKLEAAN